MTCIACKSAKYSVLGVREMMFGLRDTFDYRLCDDCHSIQIAQIPSDDDLKRYYPGHYYSFKMTPYLEPQSLRRTLRTRAWHLARGRWPRMAAALAPHIHPVSRDHIERYDLAVTDRVLDIGCGTGTFVVALAEGGIRSPLGIDPFVAEPLTYANGAKVLKAQLETFQGAPFDVIFLHHALEHVPNPCETLIKVASLLKPDGRCIVRIPTTSSEAFDRYGANWVDLDPPRHFFVPSREAMRLIAEQCGLALESITDDSVEFQFWGSELYCRDIPLTEGETYVDPLRFFEAADLAAFKQQAETLNSQGRGDQAIFVLRKRDGAMARTPS